MSKKKAKRQAKVEKQISDQYGDQEVKQSQQNWNSYSDEKKAAIIKESNEIFVDLAKLKDEDPDSEKVQQLMVRWHQFLLNFYNPSIELLRGLNEMYADDPKFKKKFEKIDPDLPDFLHASIDTYVDKLEDQWVEENQNTLDNEL
ncbi:TipAS antibiotic-recognition domain-containing protein [Fructilactobacillus cliffordii]|uniref:TipAS antibiotic-recognition domain-containing protein n=1 Tax=Fructilactobacillus cliffordii TaxID=2940299 RepID=UPI002093CDBC|nr:TipAS antibiotic-recognition domain-containing protein [Fructilactobacillus cliffordii]USS85993.1 TipAS antibiotic-recognition domain-containing protein [Fructilactobacillus cliffordii]